MSGPLEWYDHNGDNPPWIKALAEVRIQATREGWCHAHVQMTKTQAKQLVGALKTTGMRSRLRSATSHPTDTTC
jgi:hypothetical protein